MLITHALYGLKTNSASFRYYLAEKLYEFGYTPTKADPDVWLRKAVKAYGFQYYEMVLCYVDDVLFISYDPMKTMDHTSLLSESFAHLDIKYHMAVHT